MRQEFIQTNSRYQAHKSALWASKIAKVIGGFIAFESIEDYKVWVNQK